MLAIDSSIVEMVKLREELDILEEGKERCSLKSIRRRDMIPIGETRNLFPFILKQLRINYKKNEFVHIIHKYKYKYNG